MPYHSPSARFLEKAKPPAGKVGVFPASACGQRVSRNFSSAGAWVHATRPSLLPPGFGSDDDDAKLGRETRREKVGLCLRENGLAHLPSVPLPRLNAVCATR